MSQFGTSQALTCICLFRGHGGPSDAPAEISLIGNPPPNRPALCAKHGRE